MDTRLNFLSSTCEPGLATEVISEKMNTGFHLQVRRGPCPSAVLDLLHADVLDANLFSQDLNLLPEPVLFSLLSKLRVVVIQRELTGHARQFSDRG
jgi:hypothetical protein